MGEPAGGEEMDAVGVAEAAVGGKPGVKDCALRCSALPTAVSNAEVAAEDGDANESGLIPPWRFAAEPCEPPPALAVGPLSELPAETPPRGGWLWFGLRFVASGAWETVLSALRGASVSQSPS